VQQQDQLLPEARLADLLDGAAEVGVHADFAKQVVHPRGSGAKGHPVSSFSGPAVKGRNPKW
jgi:hypothetical protein